MDESHRTFWRGSTIRCDYCPKTWNSDQEYRADDEPCAHEERVYQPALAKMLGIKAATLRAYRTPRKGKSEQDPERKKFPDPSGYDQLGHPWWYASVAVAIIEARRSKEDQS